MNARESLDEELFELERRIARRADELSRQFGFDRGRSLDHWLQAEREVLEDECLDGDVLDLPAEPGTRSQ